MGNNKKKKRQKTKELSVAIAEASASEKGGQHEQIIQPRRKRGRPRKVIVENKIIQEKNLQQELLEASTAATQATTKKDEDGDKEPQQPPLQLQQEGDEDVLPLPKASTRARRKSKPRKSA